MAEYEEIVENFFGVYLLYSQNPKYKGQTYIGFTTDPNRRVKQHNRGTKAGGAMRTSNRGPWDMVLIVHGFPNDISALRFEWAWTYPHKSRRLKDEPKKRNKETKYDFCLRILSLMLNTKPWSRLPLTLRWLKQEYIQEFPVGKDPPIHMPIAYGPVKPSKVRPSTDPENDSSNTITTCALCLKTIEKNCLMKCFFVTCNMTCHITCLASHFLKDDSVNLIPVEGTCPTCDSSLLWGDLVRQMKGCYQNHETDSQQPHWTDALSQC